MRALLLALLLLGSVQAAPLQVGSKRFTESYVLAEIVAQQWRQQGGDAVHRQGLGNTAIVLAALQAGEIDVYPEYSGTVWREILRREGPPPDLAGLNAALVPLGLKAAVPLGFNNSYALGVRAEVAAARELRSLSDLAALDGGLRLGLSHEFLQRSDGWPGLVRAYGLRLDAGAGLDHGLAYRALAQGQIDLTDVYSTDAQIEGLGLTVLRDDRGFFPRYDALLLMRAELDATPLLPLAQRIDEARMVALNADVELRGLTPAQAAAGWLQAPAPAQAQGVWGRLWAPDLPRLLAEHGLLVAVSVAAAGLLGLPLGLAAQRSRRLRPWVLGAVGLLQTVPALALLALLIAALGRIGTAPALAALTLYALLPIVRNTLAGLDGVARGQCEAGLALGLRPAQVLWAVELPQALPVLLAGVRTAAVINVGGATLAAFVGAGGLGERIVQGLAVNDAALLLAGALPAAALALAVEGGFAALSAVLRRASPGARSRS
jgi:osmoprotectant transport system permease protein